MSFNPAVSGISGATDVAVSAKQDNQVLTYDSTVDKWRNESVGIVGVTGLAAALEAKAIKAQSVGVVKHGSDASVARPSGWASIQWIGSVSPSNLVANSDTWLNTSGSTPSSSTPAIPLSVTRTTSGTQAVLSWQPPSSDGGSTITGYRVARDGTDNTGYGTYTTDLPATDRSITFLNLNPGDTYTLTVAAINANGVGAVASGTVTVPAGTTNPTPATAWMSGASGINTVSDNFANWRGRPLDIIGTWNDDSANTQTGQWSLDPQYAGQFPNNYAQYYGDMDATLGAIFGSETWGAAATGAYDARWTQALQKMNSSWAGKGILYVRFAHEFNLSPGFPWRVNPGQEANFVTAWRRFHALFQTHMDARHQLVWSGNWETNTSGLNLNACWPGNAYVDVVSVDYYNVWPATVTAAEFTTKSLTTTSQPGGGPRGVEMWRQFAESKGKPLAVSEWGASVNDGDGGGGGDYPEFIQAMYDWVAAHGGTGAGDILYEIYFNVENFGAGNGTTIPSKHQLYPITDMPNSAARYVSLW